MPDAGSDPAAPAGAPADAIRDVLVTGDGITGWCAAAALRRQAPFLRVTVVAGPPAPDALADRIASTLPSILAFHADLGIGEDDGVARTGSGYRLGTLFSGWSGTRPDYVHAYGPCGRAMGGAPFHAHWVRAAREGTAEPFDGFSPAAALARAGRLVPLAPDPAGLFAGLERGLTIEAGQYRAMMRAYALHLGATEVPGEVTGARLGGDGRIAAAVLADGRTLDADLFVDATGPAALLRSALPGTRDDWSRWLPCDRVWLADGPRTAAGTLDRATALPAGWRWSAASATGGHHGVAWSSAHGTQDEAARQLAALAGAEPAGEPARIAAGARRDPWAGNCVAIGDAATALEPLEWCNLHLTLSGIDRLVSMLPDRNFAPVELADYNRQSLAEAERVRDFVALHYAIAVRAEPMWRALAATEPPASLAHTLAQFRERGRLPFYEEETFARDSWLAVLLGQGALPRRVDPLAEAMPADRARAAMTELRAAISRAIAVDPYPVATAAAQTRRLVQ